MYPVLLSTIFLTALVATALAIALPEHRTTAASFSTVLWILVATGALNIQSPGGGEATSSVQLAWFGFGMVILSLMFAFSGAFETLLPRADRDWGGRKWGRGKGRW